MSDSANTATGGMLVILGVLLALAVGIFLYRGGIVGHDSSTIKIDLPKVEVPAH